MDSQNYTFIQAIRLPHAELWYSRDSDLMYSTQGDVQILYSQSLDKFILRLQEFRVLLDKSLPVISSTPGKHSRQHFFIPRGVGFTMIRLPEGPSTPALENFETLLENTTSFSRQSGLDNTLATFKEHKESGFATLLSSVSKAFAPVVDTSHPNQKIVRSFDELKDLDSHGTYVVDLNGTEIESMSKKNELDVSGSQTGDLWKSFMGQGTYTAPSRPSDESHPKEDCQTKEGHQKTIDVQQSAPGHPGQNSESKHQTHKYHPSIDHQEVVGAQEQRLPSYEVHNSAEFLQKNLRKASANFQPGEGSDNEKQPENAELPEPEDFDDEAFTTGLLTKDHKQVSNIGSGQSFPVSNEDAFTDLRHPMRKFSIGDRPFLNIDNETHAEPEKPKQEAHKGFTGQPILTAKGKPTLKSNIDDQPSPIPNTEKYSEPTQPEKSSFAKSNDVQPMQPSNTVGQQNIVRESSQGNETKKHRKIVNEPVDKENVRSTAV